MKNQPLRSSLQFFYALLLSYAHRLHQEFLQVTLDDDIQVIGVDQASCQMTHHNIVQFNGKKRLEIIQHR